MNFVVLYDANVLYPNVLRDLLIRIAQAGLVHARWTERILDEVFTNVQKNRPDLDPERLARTRQLMNRALRDCLVTDYESLIPALTLPDPDDRHVLAAAIRARAQVIVTDNLRHFPLDALRPFDIEPLSADDFVSDQVDLSPKTVWGCVQQIADSRRNPPMRPADVLVALERCGLVRSVANLGSER
ncbi:MULTISPECIES: PIN domain-containing protein [Polymorphospora]|uniref:PIN domain-containing protein n=1 Tax=Polymorphospora lycopeni TaxID=3140240 RepID=A0ABV5CPI1_9ACTN